MVLWSWKIMALFLETDTDSEEGRADTQKEGLKGVWEGGGRTQSD